MNAVLPECFGSNHDLEKQDELGCHECAFKTSCGEAAFKSIPTFVRKGQPMKRWGEPADAAPQVRTAADVLADMAHTYRERNAVYGNNYLMVSQLVKVLFPNGVPSELVVTDHWHLFELKLVKLSRFAISNLTHVDSIHDDAVYSAMIEAILNQTKEQ